MEERKKSTIFSRPSFFERVLTLTEKRAKLLTKPTLIDQALSVTLLRLIPKTVTPNQITLFRFFSIPFIVVLLLLGYYEWGATLFAFAAVSDALDGALARTTKHITVWGILADPLADKLLIGSVALILISRFLGRKIALLILVMETLTLLSAYVRYKGKVIPAKLSGKVKMFLECVGILFLFGYVLFDYPALGTMATDVLITAVVFGVLSLLVYKSV